MGQATCHNETDGYKNCRAGCGWRHLKNHVSYRRQDHCMASRGNKLARHMHLLQTRGHGRGHYLGLLDRLFWYPSAPAGPLPVGGLVLLEFLLVVSSTSKVGALGKLCSKRVPVVSLPLEVATARVRIVVGCLFETLNRPELSLSSLLLDNRILDQPGNIVPSGPLDPVAAQFLPGLGNELR